MDFGNIKINNNLKSDATPGRSKSCNGIRNIRSFSDINNPPLSSRMGTQDIKQDNCKRKNTPPCNASPKKNYAVRLGQGQYQVNIHWPTKQSPISITLTPDKEKELNSSVPQQPLLYEESNPSTLPPFQPSFPKRVVNKLFHPSTPNTPFNVRNISLHQKVVGGCAPRRRPGQCMESPNRYNQRKGKHRVAERKKSEGNEFYKSKQYRDAIKLYSEAIELCPECASYYSNRSACHMMLGKYAQALADAREAVRLDASFVKGYLRVAKCNIALGDANAALSVLRQASEFEPSNKVVQDEFTNANALIRCEEEVEKATAKRDFRTAIYHLDRALALAMGCRSLKIKKAEYLVYLQRYSDAQEIVNDILQYDSVNVDAIYVRGMCLYYQDNQDAAFIHFQHVLKLAPDHKKAKEIYKKAKLLKIKKEDGNTAFKKGNLREALNLYTEALAIDVNNKTTNSKLYCNRATVKSKLCKLDDAADDCTAAINLNEGYIKAYLRRAKCYQDLEKHDDAVRDYEKVCKLDRSQEHKRLLQDAKVQLKCSKRKDYYKILGVSRSATDDDIKKCYKKMALQHHPDRHANASDKEKQDHEIKFKEIGEAYSVLTDAKKKAMYDRGQDINDPDCGFGHDGNVDPNQIFQAFFNHGGSNFNNFGGGHQNFGGFPGSGFSDGGLPGGFHFQFS